MSASISADFQLLTALINCTNKIGVSKTIAKLNESANEEPVANMQFCINTVLSRLTISMEEAKPYMHDDTRKVAIGFCVYFLFYVYEYELKRLHEFLPFGIKRRSVVRYRDMIKAHNRQNPKTIIDKIIVEHFDALNTIFVNHKKSLSNETAGK